MIIEQLQQQYQSARRRHKRKILLFQVLLLIGVLLFWQLATQFRLLDPLIFSSPQAVAPLFMTKLTDGSLLPHVALP